MNLLFQGNLWPFDIKINLYEGADELLTREFPASSFLTSTVLIIS